MFFPKFIGLRSTKLFCDSCKQMWTQGENQPYSSIILHAMAWTVFLCLQLTCIYLFVCFFVVWRHWIIVDENNGTYLTQRKDHKLALVVPHFEDDKYLCLNAPNMKTLKVDMGADNEEPKKIRSFFFFTLHCIFLH